MPKKNRTLVYKSAQFPVGGVPLQARLLGVLNGLNAVNRCEETLPGSGAFLFINHFELRENDGLFLSWMLVNEDENPLGISMVGNAVSLPVHVITPTANPAHPDVPVEVVESTAYALINGNHVIFLSTSALRWGRFRDHLNWLLSRNLQNVPEVPAHPLAAAPTQGAAPGEASVPAFRLPPLRELSALHNSAFDDYVQLLDRDVAPQGVSVKKVVFSQSIRLTENNNHRTASGVGGAAVRAALGQNRTFLEGLTLDQCSQISQIKAQVTLSLHGDESVYLDRVAAALQLDEDLKYVVFFNDGTKVRRDEIEATTSVKLDIVGKAFLPNQIRDRMIAWLVELLSAV